MPEPETCDCQGDDVCLDCALHGRKGQPSHHHRWNGTEWVSDTANCTDEPPRLNVERALTLRGQ